MNFYGDPVTRLINELSRLPGIGEKSAQKLAFHIIGMPYEKVESLSKSIIEAKKTIKYCSLCCNLTDSDPCKICSDSRRDKSVIMVVENPRNMAAYEKTKGYKGLYHILHGAISPMNNISPSDIKIKELLERLSDNDIKEVIIATNPTVEGEATASYICRLIKPMGIKVSRIAKGIPIGGSLEYADEITLSQALEGRREM